MRTHAGLLLALASCSDSPPEDPWAHSQRPPRTAIGCADPTDAAVLVPCDTGSTVVGAWEIDADGLPAFDVAIDGRCDAAMRAYSPSPHPPRDPLHVVGDGYGLVAMAHASG